VEDIEWAPWIGIDFVADEKDACQVLANCRRIHEAWMTVKTVTDALLLALEQPRPPLAPPRWRHPVRALTILSLHVTESVHITVRSLQAIATACPLMEQFFVHTRSARGKLDISVHDIQDLVVALPRLETLNLLSVNDDMIREDDKRGIPLAAPVNPVHLDGLRRLTRPEYQETIVSFCIASWTDPDSYLIDSIVKDIKDSTGACYVKPLYWIRLDLRPTPPTPSHSR
jgi:hypothetical protein